MDNFELDDCLRRAVIQYDTREHQNTALNRRIKQMGCETERRKLKHGDYSIGCRLPDGSWFSLEDKVCVERKQSLTELAMCFGKERGRFEREISGAAADGKTIYLVVENGTWGMLYDDMGYKMNCRSKLPRQSIIASLRAWQVRYGWHIDFCREEISGYVIKDILLRELKIALEKME